MHPFFQAIAATTVFGVGLTCTLVNCAAQEPSPLITRERIKLNLTGAELIIATAKQKAAELKVNANIAVVDDGGHLLAFARMDNAQLASVATVLTKAAAAATMRQSRTLPAWA